LIGEEFFCKTHIPQENILIVPVRKTAVQRTVEFVSENNTIPKNPIELEVCVMRIIIAVLIWLQLRTADI
jgi:hypothetical protein